MKQQFLFIMFFFIFSNIIAQNINKDSLANEILKEGIELESTLRAYDIAENELRNNGSYIKWNNFNKFSLKTSKTITVIYQSKKNKENNLIYCFSKDGRTLLKKVNTKKKSKKLKKYYTIIDNVMETHSKFIMNTSFSFGEKEKTNIEYYTLSIIKKKNQFSVYVTLRNDDKNIIVLGNSHKLTFDKELERLSSNKTSCSPTYIDISICGGDESSNYKFKRHDHYYANSQFISANEIANILAKWSKDKNNFRVEVNGNDFTSILNPYKRTLSIINNE